MLKFLWTSGGANDLPKPPALLKYRSAKNFIIFVVALAAFTDVFLYGVIVPVIPTAITERAGVPIEKRQQIVSLLLAAYGGSLLVSAPPLGVIADHTASRRAPLLVGLLALGAATALLCIGTSVAILVIGRILQGISAALVWTVGTALLVDTVEKDAVGQSMGWIILGMTAGTVLGPLLGGIVYDAGGYYAVFAMAFAIILVDILLRLVLIEKKVAAKWNVSHESRSYGTMRTNLSSKRDGQSPDRKDQRSLLVSEGDEETRGDDNDGGGQLQNKGKSIRSRLPAIIQLLTYPTILLNLLGCMIASELLVSLDAVLPIYTMETFGWNPTSQGAIFLAVFIPTLSSPLIGRLADIYNPRSVAIVGFILSVPACILLRLVTQNTLAHKVILGALLAVLGLSQTIIMTPLMAEMNTYAMSIDEKEHTGGSGGMTAQANGLFNCAFAAGTLVGPSLAGYLKDRYGWGTMGLVQGMLGAAMAVIMLLATVYEARAAKGGLYHALVSKTGNDEVE